MYYEMLDVYAQYLPMKKYLKSSFLQYCYDYYNNEHWIEPRQDWFIFRNVCQSYYYDVVDLTRLYYSYLYSVHGSELHPCVIPRFKRNLYKNLKHDPQTIIDLKMIKTELDIVKGEFKTCVSHHT